MRNTCFTVYACFNYSTSLSNNDLFHLRIDHFTVLCSVTWPLNGSETGSHLALIQTSLLLSCKCAQLALDQLVSHNKTSDVCIKIRSPPALLSFKGQITEQDNYRMAYSTKETRLLRNDILLKFKGARFLKKLWCCVDGSITR